MTKNKNAGIMREKLTEPDSKETQTLLAVLSTPTYQAAAKKLGISYVSLWERMKKYKTKEKIAELPQEALMRLQIGSIRAAEEFISELDHHKVEIRYKAAGEILDRVGIALPRGNNTNVEVSGDKVIAILGGATSDVQSDNSDKEIT